MRALARLGLVVALTCIHSSTHVVALARWAPWDRRIDYPPISIPGTDHERMTGMVMLERDAGGPSQLRFDLQWTAMDGKAGASLPMPKPIADAHTIHMVLHTAGGPPKASEPFGWIGVGGASTTWSLMSTFAWGRNALDEAWIEVRAAGCTFWFELPYGFARNPADPELPDTTRSTPAFPATMRTPNDNDVLVPWLRVGYQLDSRLSLEMENAGDARAQVRLDTDESKPSPFTLDSPRVAMTIRTSDGTALVGREVARLMGPRRNVFEFNRYIASTASRTWGTAVIAVDGVSHSLAIPSSLFEWTHGVTDPENPHRLPMPPRVIR